MAGEEERVGIVISDQEWHRAVRSLAECGPQMEQLVRRALQGADLHPHTVTHRVKGRASAARKIERKAANYSLSDITDLLGLRVITYFDYEVSDVAEIIEKEFVVDWDNSVDKRTTLDPDRFGYLSLHYVVSLNQGRLALPEYRNFENVKFEIQIRSILQHAWAEIEHDLGYRTENAIPAQLRRRFSRLAGLLELADEEFTQIRKTLAEYETEVKVAVRDNELNVAIDRDSTAAYIKESTRLAELEEQLASSLGSSRTQPLRPVVAEARANELRAVGFADLTDVDRALERDGEVLWRFVRNWFRHRERARPMPRPVNPGILLLYVAIAEAMRRPQPEAADLLDRLGVGAAMLDRLRREWHSAREEASSAG
jgi:ppGpp synthetase/RelA/SpoT-type nucleotidyltranferase